MTETHIETTNRSASEIEADILAQALEVPEGYTHITLLSAPGGQPHLAVCANGLPSMVWVNDEWQRVFLEERMA